MIDLFLVLIVIIFLGFFCTSGHGWLWSVLIIDTVEIAADCDVSDHICDAGEEALVSPYKASSLALVLLLWLNNFLLNVKQ